MAVPRLHLQSAISRAQREAELTDIGTAVAERSRVEQNTLGFDTITITRDRRGVLLNGYRQADIMKISSELAYPLTDRPSHKHEVTDRALDLERRAERHTNRHQAPRANAVALREYNNMATERAAGGIPHSTWSTGKDELMKHYLRVAHAPELRDLLARPAGPPVVVVAIANEKLGDITRPDRRGHVRTFESNACVTVYRSAGRVTAYPTGMKTTDARSAAAAIRQEADA